MAVYNDSVEVVVFVGTVPYEVLYDRVEVTDIPEEDQEEPLP
jgi:hypothetical protein